MRIYFSIGQDPMLLDSLVAMNALHDRLRGFVASTQTVLALPADQSGTAAPYAELLAGIELRKGDGPLDLRLTPQRWLSLSGSQENLARYVEFFRFDDDEEGAHHHPEHANSAGYIAPGTMSLIIEVDSSWVEEMRDG